MHVCLGLHLSACDCKDKLGAPLTNLIERVDFVSSYNRTNRLSQYYFLYIYYTHIFVILARLALNLCFGKWQFWVQF